jgi:hypothetical protein
MSPTNPNRVQAGTPAGGQFAAKTNPEAGPLSRVLSEQLETAKGEGLVFCADCEAWLQPYEAEACVHPKSEVELDPASDSSAPDDGRLLPPQRIQEIWDSLRGRTRYGPDYDRGVASAVADSLLFLERENAAAATHYAQLARCRAGEITWDEFCQVDPYRAGTEKGQAARQIETAAITADVGDEVSWEVARALPVHTEVSAEFSATPGRHYRLMARDLPQIGTKQDRRFTNLDTGFEVFLPADGLRPLVGREAGIEPMFTRLVITKTT